MGFWGDFVACLYYGILRDNTGASKLNSDLSNLIVQFMVQRKLHSKAQKGLIGLGMWGFVFSKPPKKSEQCSSTMNGGKQYTRRGTSLIGQETAMTLIAASTCFHLLFWLPGGEGKTCRSAIRTMCLRRSHRCEIGLVVDVLVKGT